MTCAGRTKIMLAVTGGGAVLVMGAFTVVVDDSVPPSPTSVAAPILPGPMTQGDTVTTTIDPTQLAKAKPPVKAKPYGG